MKDSRNDFHWLCDRYGTDKARHYYDLAYTLLFENRRHEVRKVLEIGVLDGASLRVWLEYFPNAQIVGVDRQRKCQRYESERVRIVIGDQADPRLLRRLAQQGPYDLIVDDGGHRMHQQQASLRYLLPAVRPGGVYVIEDLETSFRPHYNPTREPRTTVDLLLDRVRTICAVPLDTLTDGYLFWGNGCFILRATEAASC